MNSGAWWGYSPRGLQRLFSKITLTFCMALATASFWLFFFFLNIASLRENVVS